MNKLIFAALAIAFTANVATAQSVVETLAVPSASSRTLYTFDQDAANKSTCNGGCAAAWPPFLVKAGDAAPRGLRAITRDDGTEQWAMNGKPLYFYAGDVQPGDAKGDGQGGVWHVVRAVSNPPQMKTAPAAKTADVYRPGSGY